MGSIGKRHYQNLSDLLDKVNIKGIDVQDSLNAELSSKPDVVFVCTPTPSHVPIALEILSRKIPCFIEKPLSNSENDLDELVRLSENVPNMVACNLRFSPAYSMLKKFIDPTRRGMLQVTYGLETSQWKGINQAGWGEEIVLEDIHEIDYCDWMLGGLKTLKATMTPQLASLAGEAWDSSLASICIDCISPKPTRKARLVYDGLEVLADNLTNQFEVRTPLYTEACLVEKKDQYVEEIKSFLESLRQGNETANPIREAARVLKLVVEAQDSCYNSSQENLYKIPQ